MSGESIDADEDVAEIQLLIPIQTTFSFDVAFNMTDQDSQVTRIANLARNLPAAERDRLINIECQGDEDLKGQVMQLLTSPRSSLDAQSSESIDRFNQAWVSGDPPRIEDFLPENVPQNESTELVEELILLDLGHRHENNLPIHRSDYESRFSTCIKSVESAFFRHDKNVIEPTIAPSPQSESMRSEQPIGSSGRRYEYLHEHARGGLGVVYKARDHQLDREVAIKEIKQGTPVAKSTLERFMFEAKVTGALQHPSVVPIYDLGRNDQSLPFYAMRFIDGSTLRAEIDQFHQRHADDVRQYEDDAFRELLWKFIDVCRACHHAHERGFLHRDIKPANVMIGEQGETFLVDWGLAKVFNASEHSQLSEQSVDLDTMDAIISYAGKIKGTPNYMSPEQARGAVDVDCTSDVYSLGAVLYCILSGDAPIAKGETREVLARVQRGEVQSLAELAPGHPRPLASICGKAMSVSPARRYRTANALAKEVERWINDRPVDAHRERWIEALGRMLRRNRSMTVPIVVGLSLLSLVSLLATGLVSYSWQQQRKERMRANSAKESAIAARDDATRHYRQSRKSIDKWLIGSDDALRFYPSMEPVRRKLLEEAAKDYRELANENIDGASPELLLEQVRAVIRLGMIDQRIDDFQAAREKYEEAFGLLRSLTENPAVRAELKQECAREEAGVHTRMAVLLDRQGEYSRAEGEYRRAIESLVDLENLPEARADLYGVRQGLAELLMKLHDPKSAIEILLDDASKPETSNVADLDFNGKFALAREFHLLGRARMDTGEFEASDSDLNTATEIIQSLFVTVPDSPDYLQARADVADTRAALRHIQGRASDEMRLREDSIRDYRLLVEVDAVPRNRERLGKALVGKGIGLIENGRSDLALEPLEEAQRLFGSLTKTFPNLRTFQVNAAACYDALGQSQMDLNEDPSVAANTIFNAVRAYRNLSNPTDDEAHRFAVCRNHYGLSLAEAEQRAIAVKTCNEALSALEGMVSQNPENRVFKNSLAHVHDRIAWLLRQDDIGKSKANFKSAFKTWQEIRQLDEMPEGPPIDAIHAFAVSMATCPHKNLRDLETATQMATLASDSAPDNHRFAATLALVNAMAGKHETATGAMDQIQESRGERIGREFYIVAIALNEAGETQSAREAREQGDAWYLEYQPFGQEFVRLRELVVAQLESK